MADDTKHKIKLTEFAMKLIKETVEKTSYLGIHSETVSYVRKKMTIKEETPKE